MSDSVSPKALDRQKLLEWLRVEIDLSSGNTETHKADRWAFGHVRAAIRRGEFDIPSAESSAEIESLKAITELAVKGLKEIACLNVDSDYSAGTIARNTFSEIERLTHAK